MIYTSPIVESIIQLHIHHKEQEFLTFSITTTKEFQAPVLEVHMPHSSMKIKGYYFDHKFENGQFIYTYGAYDEQIFNNYLQSYKSTLPKFKFASQNNILNGEKGFFYIHPFSHEVLIDEIYSEDKHIYANANNLLSIEHTYNNEIYNINTKLFYPPMELLEEVTIHVPNDKLEYADLLCEQDFVTDMKYTQQNDYSLVLSIQYQYDRVLEVVCNKVHSPLTKYINLYLEEISQTEEQLWSLIKQITEVAFYYHNREEVIVLHFRGVEEHLSLQSYILHNGNHYKIIDIEIKIETFILCKITAVRSGHLPVSSFELSPPQTTPLKFEWQDIFLNDMEGNLSIKKDFYKLQYITCNV